ncbi:Reverse transcriptase domain protein [Ceratobasidium sp. AG-Ba]|nr:Reverse transcriptase domain protein [Ceratobasidium sp. AG-Ba]
MHPGPPKLGRTTGPPTPPPSSGLSDAPPLPGPAAPEGPAGIRRPHNTPTALFDEGGDDRNREHNCGPVGAAKPDARKCALTSPEENNPNQRREYIRLLRAQADRLEEELATGRALAQTENPDPRSKDKQRIIPKPDVASLGLDRGIRKEYRPRNKDKNRDRSKSPSSASTDLNDSVIPGHTAAGMQHPIAENVVAIFRKGFVKHVALTTLDDEYCEKIAWGHISGHTLGFNNQGGIQVLDVDVKDPSRDKHTMSFAQWDQAVPRFLGLVRDHLRRKDYDQWRQHFELICKQPTLHSEWELWLGYDIQMRIITRRDKSVDITVLNRSVLDDLCPRFQAKRIQAKLINSGLRIAQPQVSSKSRPHPTPPTQHIQTPAVDFSQIGVAPRTRATPVCQASVFDAVTKATMHTNAQLRPKYPAVQSSSRVRVPTGLLMENRSATNTTAPPDHASPPRAVTSTSAPCAEARTTELKLVADDPRRVTTPLLPSAWEDELSRLDLMREGHPHSFYFINSPNHKSALDRPEIVRAAISKELECGRYTGPFTKPELEACIGFFRSAPLGVVEKSTPGEFRIIQDFSYPRASGSHPALNKEIDPDAFTCEWGFFDKVMTIVASAPAGAQAATFDVDAAYRRMPVFPADQNHTVVSWKDELYIDHCVPFGAASSNGIFGRCGDAICRIFSIRGLGPVVKWVDDFLFFRFPCNPSTPLPYSEDNIYAIATLLGWLWKLAKTRLFANIFIYLGFEWDIQGRSVKITATKQNKYIQRITSWLAAPKVSLEATEKLVGTLIHCTQVARDGRPHLAGLISFVAAFQLFQQNPFHLLTPSRRARTDASWWLEYLTDSACSRPIRLPFLPHPEPCYMDASTSFGVGIIVDGHVAAWKLSPRWRTPGKDIGWAEMVLCKDRRCNKTKGRIMA